MEYLVYISIVLPWMLLFIQWSDKWIEFGERERARGVKCPTLVYVKSIPSRFVKWCVDFQDAFVNGGM